MSTYRVEWACCGSVTETESWEPEHCPFCYTPPLEKAAPDLLESLRGFIEHGTCFDADDWAKAKAAIAKATGETK